MNKQEILIIDDEDQLRKLLSINFKNNNYKIIEAETGQQGISLAASHNPELIILDINLPDKSGHEVLKELRMWYQKSIIILSVHNNEKNIITALDNGASDYLTKPFRTGELLARIRSSIRRHETLEDKNKSIITCNDLQIDLAGHTVKKNNEIVKLTTTEYKLVALFATNEGRVLTHQYILKNIWGVGSQKETQYLRVFIGILRKKLENNPNQPKHFITESGIGYRFS
jgi:two-component system KDP operon response regulator KdpE